MANDGIRADIHLGAKRDDVLNGFGGLVLEGAPSIPGSTLILKRGETAQIRTKGIGPMKQLTAIGSSVQLFGMLHMMVAPCRWAATITSEPLLVMYGR